MFKSLMRKYDPFLTSGFIGLSQHFSLARGSNPYCLCALVAGLASALWFFSVTNQGFDAHHQGFMGRAALEIFQGRVLYAESYNFYQPLPHYLNALSLAIFGNKLMSLQYMTVIGYSICGVGVSLLAYRLAAGFQESVNFCRSAGYRAAGLAVAVFLASSPETVQLMEAKALSRPIWEIELIMHPWPSVWALTFGLLAMVVGIYIVDTEKPGVKSILLMGALIGLTAASRLFSGAFLLVASIAAFLFLTRRPKLQLLILLVATAIITFSAFYIPSLIHMSLSDLWFMQITAATNWLRYEDQAHWGRGAGVAGIARVFLSYFAPMIEIGGALFLAVLMIAAGYASSLRLLALTWLSALMTAIFLGVILTYSTSVWSHIAIVYSRNSILLVGIASITGLVLWRSRQPGASRVWTLLAIIGAVSTGLVLGRMLIPWGTMRNPGSFGSKLALLILEAQKVWPGILLAFSLVAVASVVCPMISEGMDFLKNRDKGLFAASILGVSALTQLYPMFEQRHIYWSCIPLATIAVAVAVQPPAVPARVGWFNIFVVLIMLAAPFTATAIGYYVRQSAPRVPLDYGNFLEGVKVAPEFYQAYDPVLRSVKQYEKQHPDTPVYFLGFNNGFGLGVENKKAPDQYRLLSFRLTAGLSTIDFFEGIQFTSIQKFVKENKPIIWLEGVFASLAKNSEYVPSNYCVIASMPPVDKVTNFGAIVLAPFEGDEYFDATGKCRNRFGADSRAEYKIIPPQENLARSLDGFPPTHPLAEINLQLNESGILNRVDILAPTVGGSWTTNPTYPLWGVGIIDTGEQLVRNPGRRKKDLDLPIGNTLTLWIALSECVDLNITLYYKGGNRIDTVGKCT